MSGIIELSVKLNYILTNSDFLNFMTFTYLPTFAHTNLEVPQILKLCRNFKIIGANLEIINKLEIISYSFEIIGYLKLSINELMPG